MAGTAATLRIAVVADTRQYMAGLAGIGKKTQSAMTMTGAAIGIAGLAGVAIIGKSIDAAMEWEDAMAGVSRTIMDTTIPAEEMDKRIQMVDKDLRKVATTVPIAHEEIAALAETAGALGVPAESLGEFSRVAATISTLSDDLTGVAAAFSMGKIRTVMGLAEKDLNRFGSTVVKLGQSGASTEGEILSMAERASGAASLVGMSMPQLLGWASAMANIGEESEAGGTSIQRFALGINEAVATGSSKLTAMAKAAGMTAEAFSAAFEKDASGAMQTLMNGIAQMDAQTGQLALKSMGFNDIRITRGILKMTAAIGTGGQGNLNDALTKSNAGWEDENFMNEVAAERFATTEKQLQLLGNRLYDIGITIGSVFLPPLMEVVTHISNFASVLGTLIEEFPAFKEVLIPIVGILATLAALKFGHKFMTMLLPTGAMSSVLAGAYDHLVDSGILTPVTKKLSAGKAAISAGIKSLFTGAASVLTGVGTSMASTISGSFLGEFARKVGAGLTSIFGAGTLLGGAFEKVGALQGGRFGKAFTIAFGAALLLLPITLLSALGGLDLANTLHNFIFPPDQVAQWEKQGGMLAGTFMDSLGDGLNEAWRASGGRFFGAEGGDNPLVPEDAPALVTDAQKQWSALATQAIAAGLSGQAVVDAADRATKEGVTHITKAWLNGAKDISGQSGRFQKLYRTAIRRGWSGEGAWEIANHATKNGLKGLGLTVNEEGSKLTKFGRRMAKRFGSTFRRFGPEARKRLLASIPIIQNAWSVVEGALSKGPKIMSGKKRLAQLRKAVYHAMQMMRKAVKANDPVAASYWADQYMKVKSAQGDYLQNTDQVMTDVRGLIRSRGTESTRAVRTMGRNWTGAINETRPAATQAAEQTAAEVSGPLTQLATDAAAWGSHLGGNYAAGITSQIPLIGAAATNAAKAAAGPLAFSHPPRKGPLRNIRRWGPHMIIEWIRPIQRNMRKIDRTGQRMADGISGRHGRRRGGNFRWRSNRGNILEGARIRGDVHFHIGTLIADDRGIDQLERRMRKRRHMVRRDRRLIGEQR